MTDHVTTDDADTHISAMIRRAFAASLGFDNPTDYDLLELVMRTGYAHGFRFVHLTTFRATGRIRSFGFFRDATHYLGAGRAPLSPIGHQTVMVASTTGRFSGSWGFKVDARNTLYISHNSQPCDGFDGLDGLDLVDAVMRSALSTPIAPAASRWWKRWLPW